MVVESEILDCKFKNWSLFKKNHVLAKFRTECFFYMIVNAIELFGTEAADRWKGDFGSLFMDLDISSLPDWQEFMLCDAFVNGSKRSMTLKDWWRNTMFRLKRAHPQEWNFQNDAVAHYYKTYFPKKVDGELINFIALYAI